MTRDTPALIARDAGLAEVERQLLQVRERGPALVLVTGPAGVGRTAFLEQLVARHDGPALVGRAAAWEAALAYGVLGQLVPGEDIPADAMAAAAVLVDRARDCGPGPALVVVDDAHWADTASLQALSSAVRHHHDAALLVVLAATTGVGDAPSETLELLHRGATAEVFLAPLGPGAVTELASAHGVSLHPFVAERLTRHTGGLPRHVVQLLAELPRALWTAFDPDLPAPAEVAAGVRQALAGCSVEGRRLARAVAVLGAGTQVRDAALLAGTADVLAALDEVTAAGLVSFGVHGFTEVGPADPMVRAALLAGMGPAAVAEAHRGAATWSTTRSAGWGTSLPPPPRPTPTSPTASTPWPTSAPARARGGRPPSCSRTRAVSPTTGCSARVASPVPWTPWSARATASVRPHSSPRWRACARLRCATPSSATSRSSVVGRARRRPGSAVRGTWSTSSGSRRWLR